MKLFASLFFVLLCSQYVYSQTEKIEVEGAITLDAADNATPPKGTIQWDGSNFQGYGNDGWENLGGSFNPGLPSNFDISSVVTLELPATNTYTVPNGFNLIITDLRSGGAFVVKQGAVTATFNGFLSHLQQHISLILGEGMEFSNATNDVNINGFLTPVKTDFIVAEFPYTVPAGKTLYVTTSRITSTQIDGIDFFGARVAYEGQELTGTGSFIGYLK